MLMRRVPWAAAVFLVAVIAVSVLYLEPGPPVEADLYRGGLGAGHRVSLVERA